MHIKLPPQPTLSINAFEQMLDIKNLTNSYKLYWFGALFDEICKLHSEISFKKMLILMVVKCWYSILTYRLNLGSLDKLHELVLYLHTKYNIKNDIHENELEEFLEKIVDEDFDKRLSHFYRYVPYRMLTTFYPELSGQKEKHKNRIIEDLSRKSDIAPYRLYTDELKLEMNYNWFEYIYCNQTVIKGWYYYKIITFLQRRNPNITSLPLKLSAPRKRDLREAKKFWSKISTITTINDIYSDSIITKDKMSIDHFIPWTYVLHDQLWNLSPTLKEINSSKSDNLPNMDLYLDKFCNVQYMAFKSAIENNESKKVLEDYLYINKKIRLTKDIDKKIFISSIREAISPLYQIALNQGYPVWEYNKLRVNKN